MAESGKSVSGALYPALVDSSCWVDDRVAVDRISRFALMPAVLVADIAYHANKVLAIDNSAGSMAMALEIGVNCL